MLEGKFSIDPALVEQVILPVGDLLKFVVSQERSKARFVPGRNSTQGLSIELIFGHSQQDIANGFGFNQGMRLMIA